LAVPWSNGDATLFKPLAGLLAIFAWVFFTSLAVRFVIKLTLGIRVSEQHEYVGVDRGDCGLEAYPEFTQGRVIG
jgi:Amt family ammonium transporter